MEPLGIHHVSVNVSDAEASTAFYTGVLGGTVRGDRPDLGIGGAWIDLGSQQVHLIESAAPPNLGQHFALRVADLAAAVAELRSKGVPVNDPVRIGSGQQTFLEDPDGNLVQLFQLPDA
jgi:catechol 2,3-dioxygenase-like lactoylglutathione lyase family enzyme